MPVPVVLGVVFTPIEIDAMKAAAKLISDTINAKIALNLNDTERQNLSKVADERFVYVAKSVKEFAVDFPALNGIGYTLPNANNDFETYYDLGTVWTLLSEATERATEVQMVAGHFIFKFATDQYANAIRYIRNRRKFR